MPDRLPERRHLKRLPFVWADPAIFYVTTNVIRQQRLLVPGLSVAVADALRDAGERTGWTVGRYVVMPDHVHFFCEDRQRRTPLSDFVGGFKQMVTRRAWAQGWSGRLWQAEFFDHVLRSEESHAQKWEYVRLNPVRRGLCATPDEWPYQGEIGYLAGH